MLVNGEWTTEARGSCNVSSIAAAAGNKRETSKQKPKHPWKRKIAESKEGGGFLCCICPQRWEVQSCNAPLVMSQGFEAPI